MYAGPNIFLINCQTVSELRHHMNIYIIIENLILYLTALLNIMIYAL